MFIRKKDFEEIHAELKKLKEMHDEFEEYKEKVERLEGEVGCKEDKEHYGGLWPYCVPYALSNETLQEKVDRLEEELEALEKYLDVSVRTVYEHKEYKKNKKAKK